MKKRTFCTLTTGELCLWLGSLAVMTAAFFLFGNTRYVYLIGSMLGATSLIFIAKGNVVGQLITIVFSVFYGAVSFSFRYYGEMLTYLCMTAPMAVASAISWLKNPYKGNKAEVSVNRLKKREYLFLLALDCLVSLVFYFILRALGTANLWLSTLSVFTSFAAVYLTMRRSPLYAAAYACNDVVLIALWTLASLADREYVSMVFCFAVFLVNDVYGFFSWIKRRKRQNAEGM